MNQPKQLDVHCHGFTVASERLLMGLGSNVRPNPDGGWWMPVGSALHLVNVLKDRPDAGFPSGKWATIQHLESCIAEVRG